VTFEDLHGVKAGLSAIQQRFQQFNAEVECIPAPASKAATESADPVTAENVGSIWAIGTMQIEHTGDHVSLFLKTLQEPVEVIAMLTTVRSMLEAGSIAAWLFDPVIEGKERLGRSFAHRYEGMEQEATLARMIGDTGSLQTLKSRIDDLEQRAVSYGFSLLRDVRQRRTGIAQRMPKATEMIEMTLGLGNKYRLLSAVAHGHFWAMHQLCYSLVPEHQDIAGVPMQRLQKIVKPELVFLCAAWAFHCIARAVWNQCRYFGWPELGLEEILEDCADLMQLRVGGRFWRS